MGDVLTRIIDAKREQIARSKQEVPAARLREQLGTAPEPRGFARALALAAAAGRLALIAEIKRASPSKGLIREDFDPAILARAYADGGATCLSILTDEPFFQGKAADLMAARASVELPVLRKDFIVDPYQVLEARIMGADCLLLIMACLADAQARELAEAAHELGLDVLVEVHDGPELERALEVPADLIGINNRNLKTLAVDLATAEELAPRVPADRILVAESGLESHDHLLRMRRAGARAFLVGKSLMRQADVTATTRSLLGRTA